MKISSKFSIANTLFGENRNGRDDFHQNSKIKNQNFVQPQKLPQGTKFNQNPSLTVQH